MVFGAPIKDAYYSLKTTIFDDKSPSYAKAIRYNRNCVFLDYCHPTGYVYLYKIKKDLSLTGFNGIWRAAWWIDGHKDNSVGERKLIWDEENRLLSVDDNGFVSNYWYDADGERTVKTSGESDQVYVNGVFSGGSTNTAKFSLYVSPYLVANEGVAAIPSTSTQVHSE